MGKYRILAQQGLNYLTLPAGTGYSLAKHQKTQSLVPLARRHSHFLSKTSKKTIAGTAGPAGVFYAFLGPCLAQCFQVASKRRALARREGVA
ncbi:MAG TPA: hypothetical protein PLZ12_04835 [Saprospiraceae bacterium]|nr:hypothetical protein [Saprospiraceae bacterium]